MLITVRRVGSRGRSDDRKRFKETYAMHCPRCGLVKFGGSNHLSQRLRAVSAQHRKECWRYFRGRATWKLTVLGTFEGTGRSGSERSNSPCR